MKIAVYPGTFDPVTNGHISILKRAARVFDLVIIAVAVDHYKTTVFDLEERVALIQECINDIPNVAVEVFSGLLADFVQSKNAVAIVRGLRVVSDFEYEMQMASFNKHLCAEAETVFFSASTEFAFVSSSMIKSIAILDGDVGKFVPPVVLEALRIKYGFLEKE